MTNDLQFGKGVIDAGGSISNGWNLVKQNYGMYLGITIVATILAGCIPCVSLFLVGPILGGVYFVLFREMRGEPVDFGMMFRGFDKFVPLMVIGLLQSIPEIIGQIVRIGVNLGDLGLNGGRRGDGTNFFAAGDDALPFAIAGGLLVFIIIVAVVLVIFGIIWRMIFFFAIPLAMEHNMGPIDAIKLSARAALANVGGLILLFILEFLVALLGILMLCIGVFFVIPIIYAANAFAYRAVFPWFEQTFRNAPPPPDTYGNFGRA